MLIVVYAYNPKKFGGPKWEPVARLVGWNRNPCRSPTLRSGLDSFTQQVLLIYIEIMARVRKAAIRNSSSRQWMPVAGTIHLRPSADALADSRPLLARIVAALGTNAAARVLGVDRAQVSRWSGGTEPIGAEMGRRIVDLHDILTRILRVYGHEAAAMWLVGAEPLLGGTRPIDVLVIEGAAPVIRVIDGIMQGAYA
jgi:uncharacterized protein (DUF2384 family)